MSDSSLKGLFGSNNILLVVIAIVVLLCLCDN